MDTKAQLQERIEETESRLSSEFADHSNIYEVFRNQLAIMQSQLEILERLESVRAACIPMPECVSCNEIKPTFSMCSDCIDERVENEIKNRLQQEGKEPESDEPIILWQEYSETIEDSSWGFESVAGHTVMREEQFIKMMKEKFSNHPNNQ